MNYQVDDLALDVGQRRVSRDDDQLDVSGLTFDLFLAIVQAAPNIIGADELVEKVWSGRPTSPETITQRAMMLRQSLGDSADAPRYIEVVRGQGFRLIPKLAEATEPGKPKTPTNWGRFATQIGLVLVAVAVTFVGMSFFERESPEIRRSIMDIGDLVALGPSGTLVEVAVSPDGSKIAYTATHPGESGSQVYLRSLDDFEATPVPGSEGARHPFFSPDGEWLVFEPSAQRLVKVSINGGSPMVLSENEHSRIYGATWSQDGRIVFSTPEWGSRVSLGTASTLVQIPSSGGKPQLLLGSEDNLSFSWPYFLPGGDYLLFTVGQTEESAALGTTAILNLATGEYRPLISGAYNARYAQSGHILFGRNGALWAVPFDVDERKITGDPRIIIDHIHGHDRLGELVYAHSDNGLLVYALGESAAGLFRVVRQPVWVGLDNQVEPINIEPQSFLDARLSPDGTKFVASISNDAGLFDLWVTDLDRLTSSKLTFAPVNDFAAIWSEDGEHIYFEGRRPNGLIHKKAADGTGQTEMILGLNGPGALDAISPDGRFMMVRDTGPGESDEFLYEIGSDSLPTPFLDSNFDEDNLEFSPDGKYVAYDSNETGREEVYVRTFPDREQGKWQISKNGGNEPLWSHDGKTLFFRDNESGWISSVDVSTESGFTVGNPEIIIRGDFFNNGSPSYDISPIDGRFLLFVNNNELPFGGENPETGPAQPKMKLRIVENWFEELKRITPTESSE